MDGHLIGPTQGVAVAAPRARRSLRRLYAWLWSISLLLILGFLVLYPLSMLIVGAFSDSNAVSDKGAIGNLSFDNFTAVLFNENVYAALLNSLIACLGGTLVAVTVGVSFSWIIVRTNTPCARLIEFGSIIPLFIPPLVAGIAWSILGSPRTGLINVILKSMGMSWSINFYSMTGLIIVFGMYYAPYVYLFTSSALKNMDPMLEEAAEISGASAVRTQLTITFPLIAPAILSSILLSFVVMLGIYGIPAVLGSQANLDVLTTYIFRLTAWSPPLYNTAAAVAVILIMVTAGLVLLQQMVLAGRSYITVSGKGSRPRRLDLGKWRWLTFAMAMLYLIVVVVLPLLALVVAAFRRFLFIPNIASFFDWSEYGLGHFRTVISNPQTFQTIWNTIEVGLITAVVGGVLAFAIGYTVQRSRAPGRRLVDVISTLPVAIPGLIIGVAYLWAWVGLPGGLYGTIWLLALAFVGRFLPDTIKVLSTSLMQIHRELEEAAWISGRSLLGTIATIVLPLARPGIAAALTLLFVLAIRELGSSLFLYTSDTMVMAVLLLEFYEGSSLGMTAAFGILQILLLAALIGIANALSSTTARGSMGKGG